MGGQKAGSAGRVTQVVGLDLFSRNGHYYGNAEGGETITPVDASQNNAAALALIRTAGHTLTPFDFAASLAAAQNVPYQVLPPPAIFQSGRYADGGILPTGGLAGGYASASSGAATAADTD